MTVEKMCSGNCNYFLRNQLYRADRGFYFEYICLKTGNKITQGCQRQDKTSLPIKKTLVEWQEMSQLKY